jgi:hypothetical protein
MSSNQQVAFFRFITIKCSFGFVIFCYSTKLNSKLQLLIKKKKKKKVEVMFGLFEENKILNKVEKFKLS